MSSLRIEQSNPRRQHMTTPSPTHSLHLTLLYHSTTEAAQHQTYLRPPPLLPRQPQYPKKQYSMEMAKEPSRYHQNLCAAWRLVRKPRAVEKGLAHGTWAGFYFYKPTWRGLTIILFIFIDLIGDSIGLAVYHNTKSCLPRPIGLLDRHAVLCSSNILTVWLVGVRHGSERFLLPFTAQHRSRTLLAKVATSLNFCRLLFYKRKVMHDAFSITDLSRLSYKRRCLGFEPPISHR